MILDQFGHPVLSTLESILRESMEQATREMNRELTKKMFAREPRLLDSDGRDVLPRSGSDGFLAALRDSKPCDWMGRELSVPIVFSKKDEG